MIYTWTPVLRYRISSCAQMGLQLPNSLDFYSRVDQNRSKQIGRDKTPTRWGSCNTVPVASCARDCSRKRQNKRKRPQEHLTEVVGVAAMPNQGCSDGHTTVPSVSAMWRQDHGGDPHHPKTTTTPFKLWLLHSVQNKKNNWFITNS
jgi:hypothetical protein